LSTGTGALILFALVQITMLGLALRSGEVLRLGQWLGLVSCSCASRVPSASSEIASAW
jgi:hypothetical protein